MNAEGQRLQQQVSNLRTEKNALEKDIVRMQQRITELEQQIGEDDENLN